LEEIRNSDRSYIVDPENPPEGFRSINWAINAEAFLAAVISVATDYQKPLEKRETARFFTASRRHDDSARNQFQDSL
jgi:hypothetical protein